MKHRAIGGYFELELEQLFTAHDTAYRLQSARSALSYLVLNTECRCIWLPSFLCHTLQAELEHCGIETKFYSLNEDLTPGVDLQPTANELVLIVNYFGWSDKSVESTLAQLPRERCIVDNAQALWCQAFDCLGTVYSPRKFLPLPDGGLLVTKRQLQEPKDIDTNSTARCQHLLIRADAGPEAGRQAFLEAEESLAGLPHLKMSVLTRKLLKSLDQDRIQRRREVNLSAVHSLLGKHNQFAAAAFAPQSPLSYPLQVANRRAADDIRQQLLKLRVFSPIYWPESLHAACPVARHLASSIVHIPIDHRYTPDELCSRLSQLPDLKKVGSSLS